MATNLNPVQQITVAQAARLISRSPQHVRGEISRGRIHASRKPGEFMVDLSSLLAYAERLRGVRQPAPARWVSATAEAL